MYQSCIYMDGKALKRNLKNNLSNQSGSHFAVHTRPRSSRSCLSSGCVGVAGVPLQPAPVVITTAVSGSALSPHTRHQTQPIPDHQRRCWTTTRKPGSCSPASMDRSRADSTTLIPSTDQRPGDSSTWAGTW